MANAEHLAILEQGVETWNAWRKDRPGLSPDLCGADLCGADLSGANLSEADLTYATLMGANLSGANLWEADFARAFFGLTVLVAVDLSKANNLDVTDHVSASTIDIYTLYRSKGQIPASFLRGAGVPDSFITFIKSLVGSAIEFYSCFISYSTQDQPFAERLFADLQANGVRCWFSPHHAQRGRKLHEQIDDAIRLHEKLLLIVSEDSMKSEWVKTEIAKARKRELRENIQVLFPVSLVPYEEIKNWECFDADTGKDSAREIREYLIGDFQHWKDHDAYQSEFEKLLRDLKSAKTRMGSPKAE